MAPSVDFGVQQCMPDAGDPSTEQYNPPVVSFLWKEVVARLEASVEHDLCSDDYTLVLKAIRTLRQFVVASVMNKFVIGNSEVLRPKLLYLLGRLNYWSITHKTVCIDLFGLINSLIRDCSTFCDQLLNRLDLLEQLLNMILDSSTDPLVIEAGLLLLRSLFKAEDLASVLNHVVRKKVTLYLFTTPRLEILVQSFISSVVGSRNVTNSSVKSFNLTTKAKCRLIELLSLLATDAELAERMLHAKAFILCHQIITYIACKHSVQLDTIPNSNNDSYFNNSSNTHTRSKQLSNRISCQRIVDPANHLAAKFALKLMVHLFFHLPSSLTAFKQVYGKKEPLKLVACYTHLTGTIPPAVPNVCYSTPRNQQRTKRVTGSTDMSSVPEEKSPILDDQPKISTSEPQLSDDILLSKPIACAQTDQLTVSVSAYAPLDAGTSALIGLLRGLIYWRLANQSNLAQTIEAIDQFGTHVTTSSGVGVTDDDIALLIIQPLTESCLHLEATNLITWACHVLTLVLDKRPELHLWAVYTNSFVREVDSRINSLLKAVNETSDSRNHVQLLEHLTPFVKLFACLASGYESTRVLIGELSMCKGLVEFAMQLKLNTFENENTVLEFHYSITLLLHTLSRSFSLHHTFFRQKTIGEHLLKLVEDNLTGVCEGKRLPTKLVETASATIANLTLPMCPLKEMLVDNFVKLFIRLLKLGLMIRPPNMTNVNSSNSATPSASCTTSQSINSVNSKPQINLYEQQEQRELMTQIHLNAIWGLTNSLHSANSIHCNNLLQKLITEGVWLELLQMTISISNSNYNDQTNCCRPLKNCPNNVSNNNSANLNKINALINPSDDSTNKNETTTNQQIKKKKKKRIKMDKPVEEQLNVCTSSVGDVDGLSEIASIDNSPSASSSSSSPPVDGVIGSGTVSKESGNNVKPHAQVCQSALDTATQFLSNFYPKAVSTKREGHIRILIVFQVLSLLRNILRDEQFIDSVINDHWWNITQLIITVLESNYPQSVKEQAVLVLAHIATGRLARCELHRNVDLVEKLALFMRSKNSYTKAAALTATYNLLGLETECLDTCGLLSAFGGRHKPFLLSHNRRLRVQHHRHESHRRSRQVHGGSHTTGPTSATAKQENTTTLTCGSSVGTCMAQNALEEEDEDDDQQKQQLQLRGQSSNNLEQVINPSDPTQSTSVSEPASRCGQTSSITPASTSNQALHTSTKDQPRLRTSRHRRYYRSWHPSPISNDLLLSERPEEECQAAEQSVCLTRSASLHSTSSATSTASSCVESEANVTVGAQSPQRSTITHACSHDSPVNSNSGNDTTSNTSDSNGSSGCEDEVQDAASSAQAVQPSNSPSLSAYDLPLIDCDDESVQSHDKVVNKPAFTDVKIAPVTSIVSSPLSSGSSPSSLLTTSAIQSVSVSDQGEQNKAISITVTTPNSSATSTDSSKSASHRDWEVGLCQILLPFLQELDSDQILCNTWDWLMLRSNTDGKPVFLNTLFRAWQRLYANISTVNSTQKSGDQSSIKQQHQPNSNITMDEFLKKLKESIDPSSPSASLLTSLPRHWDARHRHRCRRQHRHHCHRHYIRRQHQNQATDQPESPSALDSRISGTSLPSTTTTTVSPEEPEQQAD